MDSETGRIATTIATVIIIPVMSVLAAYLIAFIKKKTLELEADIRQKYTQSQINAAEDVINTVVAAISQTYVKQFKKEGLFSELEKTKAYELAKQKIYSILSDESVEILRAVHKDVDEWIDSKIEYYVNMDKCINSNEPDCNTVTNNASDKTGLDNSATGNSGNGSCT